MRLNTVWRIIENVFFFGALALMFWVDWRVGTALIFYELARGVEYAREFRQHKGEIHKYIYEVLLKMFAEGNGKQGE